MIKVSVKYAVICGIFLTILYHISFYFGSNPMIDISHLLFDVVIFGLFIFFAEKEFKGYKNAGILHFWQGMTIGFIVYLVATFVFVLAQLTYFSLDSDAILEYKNAAINFLEQRAAAYKEQFGEDGYQDQLREIEGTSKWNLIFSSSLKKMLAGFFITPVISIILRKQPK